MSGVILQSYDRPGVGTSLGNHEKRIAALERQRAGSCYDFLDEQLGTGSFVQFTNLDTLLAGYRHAEVRYVFQGATDLTYIKMTINEVPDEYDVAVDFYTAGSGAVGDDSNHNPDVRVNFADGPGGEWASGTIWLPYSTPTSPVVIAGKCQFHAQGFGIDIPDSAFRYDVGGQVDLNASPSPGPPVTSLEFNFITGDGLTGAASIYGVC